MYGFIEKWLANILEIPYENFILNDGNEAALLHRPVFNDVLKALRCLWSEDHDSEILKPIEINSDVVGAKLLFHKYWSNEEILNSLTSGETKNSSQMVAFVSLPRPRFDSERFQTRVKNSYNNVLSNNNNTLSGDLDDSLSVSASYSNTSENEDDSYVVPPAENGNISVKISGNTVTLDNITPHEIPSSKNNVLNSSEEEKKDGIEIKEKSEEDEFLDYFSNKFTVLLKNNIKKITKKGKIISIIGNGELPEPSIIIELADKINKNLFIFVEPIILSTFLSIKKDFKFSNIEKHTIFMFINSIGINGLSTPRITIDKDLKSICFGEEVKYLSLVDGSNPTGNIKEDSLLNEEEKDEKLNYLKKNPILSSYSKYDQIFKDTCTNVVWALKDRCFLIFTFRVSDNEKIFNKCIYELGRRFDKSLTIEDLKRIDKKYHEEISEKNKQDYIDFSISSSNAIITALIEQFEKEKQKYQEYMSKTMEHGKLMQRLSEQIKSFDKEKFKIEQEKKALNDYEETLKIPEVLSINIKDKIINIFTKNIYAQDERNQKWHDIGTFHIQIGMLSNHYSQEKTVKILNTKHQIHGMSSNMQAPHVFSDGHICHGSLATGMIEAYKRRDLFQLVYQLIIFLQNANTNDGAGEYIHKWPEVPKEIALGELSAEKNETIEKNEVEIKFDSMLADAIPVNI